MKKVSNKEYRKIYHSYLKSVSWRLLREKLFRLRGKVCERCDSTKSIEVHHKTYKNIFNEKLEDLEVLCRKCHSEEHNIVAAVTEIKRLVSNEDYFYVGQYMRRLAYNGRISKGQRKQREIKKERKNTRDQQDSVLKKKGILVRRLNREGILEVDGKKLYHYDYEYLLQIS